MTGLWRKKLAFLRTGDYFNRVWTLVAYRLKKNRQYSVINYSITVNCRLSLSSYENSHFRRNKSLTASFYSGRRIIVNSDWVGCAKQIIYIVPNLAGNRPYMVRTELFLYRAGSRSLSGSLNRIRSPGS